MCTQCALLCTLTHSPCHSVRGTQHILFRMYSADLHGVPQYSFIIITHPRIKKVMNKCFAGGVIDTFIPLIADYSTVKYTDHKPRDTDDRHVVECGYGIPVCECRASATVCEFDLEVDEIRSFTRYVRYENGEGPDAIIVRGTQGVVFFINESTGEPEPVRKGRICSNYANTENCTDPQFVDGKTYRAIIAVNGQVPGPTFIVHEEQFVIMNVKNNLTTEDLSIHWHGLHQMGTPWMDGVGQITQCPIGPSTTFRYIYRARPSGTFWYHSHSGGQRTDGVFGALIVKESAVRMNTTQTLLEPYGLSNFIDLPNKHTMTLLDWQEETSIDLFTQLNSALGFYLDNPYGQVPTSNDERYSSTRSYDGGEIGPVPYFSGIINGIGRHDDVPYTQTRLSVFTVEEGNIYRFRLIGAQGLYAYRFSIDGHRLIVVATDSYWVEPKEVDYIIIHTGERYDFLLNATGNETNYWMRAETLEVDLSDLSALPPYEPLGHVAEGILHYRQAGEPENPTILSTDYETIKNQSPNRACTIDDPCKAVNCPFLDFQTSYYIACINVDQLQLLEATPSDVLPDADPDPDCPECTFFVNFNFEGDSETSSVNGRNFISPAYPPQTQTEQFEQNDIICDPSVNCNPPTLACTCVHVRNIPKFNKTIQFVLSALGVYENAHPIHLHGHSFQVVHIGYPEYNDSTGLIKTPTQDIECGDKNCTHPDCDNRRCTMPKWRNKPNFELTDKTVRKDTVIVPAGGYVVINFLSDNPGYWFFHCHIEVHQLEGMAMIINEAQDRQNPPPDGMNQCGNFLWDISQFKEKVEFDPDEDDNGAGTASLSFTVFLLALVVCYV